VVWATLEPGPAEVRYQLEQGGALRVAAAVTRFFSAAQTSMTVGYYQHEAALNGLTSATTYRYDVFVNGVDLTALSDLLTTAPANGSGAVSFVVFGDSGSGTDSQRAIADLIAADFRANRWDLAIHTGDSVYPGGSYQLFHNRFFAIYEEWLRRRPIFFAVGNHEYYEQNGQPYLDLFAMPENGHDAMAPGYRERYYSFDYGPIHFVSLDTNSFVGSTVHAHSCLWLERLRIERHAAHQVAAGLRALWRPTRPRRAPTQLRSRRALARKAVAVPAGDVHGVGRRGRKPQ
jgi:hypothetical protein